MYSNTRKLKQNLLVVCDKYTSFQKDSIEAVAPYFSLVNVLVRANPLAEIARYLPIPSLQPFCSDYTFDLKNVPNNINISRTSVWHLPTDRGYKTLGAKQFSRVEEQIREHRIVPDLAHAHFTWPGGYVGARLKERYGIPFVITAHGYDIYHRPFINKEWRAKIEYVLNTADHVITVSQSNLKCIRKIDVSTPVTVIPNGFRSDLFYPRDPLKCRKALNIPQDKKIVLTVGNLEPVKGQTYLIEAVQKILQERKDILCVIVGAGKLRTALEHQIRSLGLEDYILLAGGKPHDVIPLWMNACDLFVLPSLNEGNPTVLPEALGCGKPFVGTRVGGVPEVIASDDYGLLVEPANPEGLAEKILVALDREWDREAILRYAERYTWENIAKEIMGVYKQVLG
jgi:glycosyltransferase involved in cell wall biosynthesis